jgi:hypothetical protein
LQPLGTARTFSSPVRKNGEIAHIKISLKYTLFCLGSEVKVSAQGRYDDHYLWRYGFRAHNLSQAGLDLLSRSIRGKISLLKDTIVSLKE